MATVATTGVDWLRRFFRAPRRLTQLLSRSDASSLGLHTTDHSATLADANVERLLRDLIATWHMDRAAIQDLHAKLDRMWPQLDFLRTRLTTYLGDGISLTYMADETPIYTMNPRDDGCPSTLISGGRYDEDNLSVLLSFVRDDTIFLDIGANVGFFSLQVARRIHKYGQVHAFEPHPDLAELLRRSAHLNGFWRVKNGAVDYSLACHAFGLSDRDAIADFKYPVGHLGGGSLHLQHYDKPCHTVTAAIRPLDDVMQSDFRCDLVKIDVQYHELQALRGMRRVIQRSPHIKILFEKDMADEGGQIAAFFAELGFELYGVRSGARLERLAPHAFNEFRGDALAIRAGQLGTERRAEFSVYPSQLWSSFSLPVAAGETLRISASKDQALFCGPAWFLPSGLWRVKLHGRYTGRLEIMITERWGRPVTTFELRPGETEHVFYTDRDLVHFECKPWARGGPASIELERIQMIREDA